MERSVSKIQHVFVQWETYLEVVKLPKYHNCNYIVIIIVWFFFNRCWWNATIPCFKTMISSSWVVKLFFYWWYYKCCYGKGISTWQFHISWKDFTTFTNITKIEFNFFNRKHYLLWELVFLILHFRGWKSFSASWVFKQEISAFSVLTMCQHFL